MQMWGTEIYQSGATKIGNSLDAVLARILAQSPPLLCAAAAGVAASADL